MPRSQPPSAHLAGPPPARRGEEHDLLHGVRVPDPYRWLEDESAPEVEVWTAGQDEYARAALAAFAAQPGRGALRRRVGQLLNLGGVGCPAERGRRLFFVRQVPGKNQPLLRVKRGGRERTLVDPNRLSDDGTVALDWWYPSPNGELLAYGLSAAGDEQSTLFVRRVGNGEDLLDRLARTRAASVAWLPDGSGFYYTHYPASDQVPAGEEHYHRRVSFHRLGESQEQDDAVFVPAHPQAWPNVTISPDGRYLLIVVAHGWVRSDLYLLDRAAPGTPTPRPLAVDRAALYDADVMDGVLYVHTNEAAPNYRLFSADVRTPERANWRELVPESEVVLSGFAVAARHLVLQQMVNATSRLALHRLDGGLVGEIPLPGHGSVTGVDGDPHGEQIYFGYTSFATPASSYSVRSGDASPRVVAGPKLPDWLRSLEVQVEQVWYPSRDGTRISMFLLHRPDLVRDGDRPTLLTGYGGFNVSRTPGFAPTALTWVEQGGLWALPNLRGGGEYGESWHKAGMLGNKQNVFDDFIAAAEWLIAQGYTHPQRLAISGGSNGGLLVGAVLTQRPDLFRAVICAVPLLDMLRYHQFRIARLWIPEYGSADDPEQFRWLYAYSPYHHVRDGERYPAVLLTTGEQDSRVDPLHARKMAALLQSASSSGLPILLRVDRRAGHGAGKPLTKLIEEQADILAFLSDQLASD